MDHEFRDGRCPMRRTPDQKAPLLLKAWDRQAGAGA